MINSEMEAFDDEMQIRFEEDPDYRLWWLLHQTRDVLFRLRNKELKQYDTTIDQAAILYVVEVLNNIKTQATPGRISRYVLREPNAVSRILTRMEQQGLIYRTRGMGKRKTEVHISLTEKGRDVYKHTSLRNVVKLSMNTISDKEKKQLTNILKKIRDKSFQDLTNINKVILP